jgi:MFS transporter, PAT family, solute carrier family 33 (acetyl-CoA transportor), member 1
MLHRRNVGHAATCNSVGQTAGFFIGFVLFLVLESKEFWNKHYFTEPSETGLITLAGYLQFWGIMFLASTIFVAIFKRESSDLDEELENNPDFGIKKAYPLLWKINKLKPIIKFSLILLTVKASFAAVDAVTTLKLIEYGIPKDKIAMLSLPMIPIQILLPFVISRWTVGSHPMNFYIKAFPYRLIMTIIIAVYVYFTPSMIEGKADEIPYYYYIAIVTIYMIYQIPFRSMYVADMAFMARISDPLVGATYMTLLNTISNLGGRWVKTFFLWFVDIVTWKSCVYDEVKAFSNFTVPVENNCGNSDAKTECIESGGRCRIDIDGYYIEVVINVIYGIIWYHWGKRTINYLQSLPLSDWHILSNRSDVENVKNEDEKEQLKAKE